MKDRLVTLVGGGGFIGRYVAQALFQAGARVRIAQRDPRGAFFLKPLGGLGQSQFVALDLTRPASIEHAVAGSDAVVNLAGSFTGNLQAIHVDGPAALARAAAANGAAFVHLSAVGADPQSNSRYGRTKGLGQAAVRSVLPQATILRPSTVFGREDQFVNRFAAMIAKAPVVPVLKPDTKFQPVFVGDVADAVVAALADPAAHGGQTYELGGPDVLTMAELHHWIGRAIGREPPFVPLPDVMGAALASVGFLPGAPISQDQWKMLQHDAVATGAGLAALGITPTPLGAVAPGWLVRYRRNGRFGGKAAA